MAGAFQGTAKSLQEELKGIVGRRMGNPSGELPTVGWSVLVFFLQMREEKH